MKINSDLDKKIEDLLNSLDGIQRAEPTPYFYTRVIGRLQRSEKSIWESMGSFLGRPVVVVASLCLIVILNAFILFRQDNNPSVSPALTTANEQVSADNEDYILASSSSFDYENIDQQ